MDRDKKFPVCFDNFIMPKEAKYTAIKVYRACPTGKVEMESFIPSHMEHNMNKLSADELKDPKKYSLSVDITYKGVKRFLKHRDGIPSRYKIAIGTTNPECGPSVLTKEYKKGSKTHVDWWLYEGAENDAYKHFEIIEAEEAEHKEN